MHRQLGTQHHGRSADQHAGRGRFRACSAGSRPGGTVNPFAIELIATTGCPTDTLRSKSWDEFATPDAPAADFVITVCDNAAGEVCPIWPGRPLTAHWSFEDPAAATGTDDDKRRVFAKVHRQIRHRVQRFVNLLLAVRDRRATQRELDAIGEAAVDA